MLLPLLGGWLWSLQAADNESGRRTRQQPESDTGEPMQDAVCREGSGLGDTLGLADYADDDLHRPVNDESTSDGAQQQCGKHPLLIWLWHECLESWSVTPQPPNPSRLRCGRLARRGKTVGRQPAPARAQTLRLP